MESDKNNIVFGGPGPENITEGAKSLGEFLLNRLKRHKDDNTIIVSARMTHLK